MSDTFFFAAEVGRLSVWVSNGDHKGWASITQELHKFKVWMKIIFFWA